MFLRKSRKSEAELPSVICNALFSLKGLQMLKEQVNHTCYVQLLSLLTHGSETGAREDDLISRAELKSEMTKVMLSASE